MDDHITLALTQVRGDGHRDQAVERVVLEWQGSHQIVFL